MRKALDLVANIIMSIVLVALVLGIIAAGSSRISGDGYPGLAGYRIFNVLSGSMNPTFAPGSAVITSEVDPANLKIGDVVTFKVPEEQDMIVTHRIVRINNEAGQMSFITRGDANNSEDTSPRPAGNIIGQVVLGIPYLGYLAAFTQTKMGLLFMIVIPALILIVLEIKNIWEALEDDSDEVARGSQAS